MPALGAVPSLVGQSPAVGRASLRCGICPCDSQVCLAPGPKGLRLLCSLRALAWTPCLLLITARSDPVEAVSGWRATARKETLVPCGGVD